MCRTGGRRCGRAYNMRLDLGKIRSVVNEAQKYRGNPSPENAHKQPIRRLANYQRKLQAEEYNIEHALDALTSDISGRNILQGKVSVKDENGDTFELELSRPAPRFDGEGIEEQLTAEELKKISSKKLSMAELKEKHPDVYDSIHKVNGVDSQEYLPGAFEKGDFEKRHSRYRNDYVKVVGDPDPEKVINQVVYLTERMKEVKDIRKDVKETLAESLPVGTRMEPAWPQSDEFTSAGIKIVETHESVTEKKLRDWAKVHGERGQQVLEDVTRLRPDSQKIKRHMPDVYEQRKTKQGKEKIKVKEIVDA